MDQRMTRPERTGNKFVNQWEAYDVSGEKPIANDVRKGALSFQRKH
jgi:hypothetical protein